MRRHAGEGRHPRQAARSHMRCFLHIPGARKARTRDPIAPEGLGPGSPSASGEAGQEPMALRMPPIVDAGLRRHDGVGRSPACCSLSARDGRRSRPSMTRHHSAARAVIPRFAAMPGRSTTLMQPSCLSRKVLYMSGPVFQRRRVGDDEGRVDLALLDPPQQIVGPAVHVGLAHADRQALVHGRAERESCRPAPP